MKKLILTFAAVAAAANLFAQGTVNFGTFSSAGTGAITNSETGQRVPLGTTFLAQLYYGLPNSAQGSLIAVTNNPVGFSGAAGFIVAGARTLLESVILTATPGPAGTPGQMATVQIRAWQASLGATYESALDSGRVGVIGAGPLTTLATGNPATMPAGTPAPLSGIRGFVLTPIPEPSTIGLGIVGLAALAFLRRRK